MLRTATPFELGCSLSLERLDMLLRVGQVLFEADRALQNGTGSAHATPPLHTRMNLLFYQKLEITI